MLTNPDLTDAVAYRHARDASAGTWYLLPDDRVVHEPAPGRYQPSMHNADAIRDTSRFVKA
jgi:hypothetical protein